MRAHVIENGVVTNTIEVVELGPYMIDAALGGSIGDSWDGDQFTPPVSNRGILMAIAGLEAQQTPRRIREAALGYPESVIYLRNLDEQIAALRGQLV